MAAWRLLAFVLAVLVLKETLSAEESENISALRGKDWHNTKFLNYHSSDSGSVENTKSVSVKDESTAEKEDLSMNAGEQDDTMSEAENMEDIQSQHQEQRLINTGKESTKLKDIIIGNSQSQHRQGINTTPGSIMGQKRRVMYDDRYSRDVQKPHWYIDSGEYYDEDNVFEKITGISNKIDNNFYYKQPVALPYYRKSYKGLSTTKEDYLDGDIYNEHLLLGSRHMEKPAPVPVSKTPTYSVIYLFPVNGYEVKSIQEHPLLYRVQLHNDHHYHPLKNAKYVSYTQGTEDELGEKLVPLTDGSLLEKDIYYKRHASIDEPERFELIKAHQNVFHQWLPVNHNSMKTSFGFEDEITSHETLERYDPNNFVKEKNVIHFAAENINEDSQSKKLFSGPWYEPFYSNNKRIHSDSLVVKTASQPIHGSEAKKYTPFATAEDIYKTNHYLLDKYHNSGKYKCFCYKDVDEAGLFKYYDSYTTNKDEYDTMYRPPKPYLFLQEQDKLHNDLTESDEVTVYDTSAEIQHDSKIKFYPYVYEEDKVVDYTDKQDHTKVIHEAGLKSDTLDDQSINIHQTEMDSHLATFDSNIPKVREEIIEEAAHKSVHKFHSQSADSIEEGKFFSNDENHGHTEFIEKDVLEDTTLNDKVIKLQETDTVMLDQPKINEEIIEAVGQKSVHEYHPHNTYSLEEENFFGSTGNHDPTDIIEKDNLNIGTLNDRIIKLHEMNTVVNEEPTKDEEIMEKLVDSEGRYHSHDINGPIEDSMTDYKGYNEYTKVTNKENVEAGTLNHHIIKLPTVSEIISYKPMITEEIVEKAVDSAVKFDQAIKFNEEEAFASKRPILDEEIMEEVADTGIKYHPHYDYAFEEEKFFDYTGDHYHAGVTKNDHVITGTFHEQIIKPQETEKVIDFPSIVLNKPTVNEKNLEEVVGNSPQKYHPHYIQDKEKKEIFVDTENRGYTEVLKTKSDSVSNQITQFHETELPSKSGHTISHGYRVTEEIEDIPQKGSYLIPGPYEEKSEISLSKHTGDLKFETEYDSTITQAALLNQEDITDDIPQSETYEISGDIPYTRPFLLKEVSEYDEVKLLDEDSDEVDADIDFPSFYKTEENHVEMGHHLDKFAKAEGSAVITDQILEEADPVIVPENIDNEVLEENKIVEDLDSAVLLENTHDKQLIEDNIAMNSDVGHDTKYLKNNGGFQDLPTESTVFDSNVVSAVQYKTEDILSMYNEEMNYEVDHAKHIYEEKTGIPHQSPYGYNEGFVWNYAGSKTYNQHLTEADDLQKKELMSAAVAKYDTHYESEAPFINKENFKVTLTDADPGIQDTSVPFSEKYGPITKYFPLPDHKAMQHHFHTKEPMNYEYQYSENKYHNDQFFVEEESREIQQARENYDVKKNIESKEAKFSVDHSKAASRPCTGHKCLPFYISLYHPYRTGYVPHWQATQGTKVLSDLYTVPTRSDFFITTPGLKKYPWQFHRLPRY